MRDCISAIKPNNIHINPVIEKKTTNKGSGVKINYIFINIFIKIANEDKINAIKNINSPNFPKR
jgi:hypothetical protein